MKDNIKNNIKGQGWQFSLFFCLSTNIMCRAKPTTNSSYQQGPLKNTSMSDSNEIVIFRGVVPCTADATVHPQERGSIYRALFLRIYTVCHTRNFSPESYDLILS